MSRHGYEEHVIACRDREIAALRARTRPRLPFTVVIDCPYCNGAHVLESMGEANVFACAKANPELSFDPSLLKLVQVT